MRNCLFTDVHTRSDAPLKAGDDSQSIEAEVYGSIISFKADQKKGQEIHSQSFIDNDELILAD